MSTLLFFTEKIVINEVVYRHQMASENNHQKSDM